MAFRSVEESSLTGIADAIRAAGETEESLLFPEGFQTAISNLGGKGAALTVTAPAGTTVTVSRDGKTMTRVAGVDGIVIFRGLETGTWTLSITDGEQTASKTVDIVADYNTSITFFSSAIHITYPSGSTCTATDGITTLTAPDTSGTWVCKVPNVGTWVVEASGEGIVTITETVTITGTSQIETVDITKRWLFKDGNQYTELTGGWSDNGYTYSSYPKTAPIIGSDIRLQLSKSGSGCCIAGTQKTVDLTPYTKIWIYSESTSLGGFSLSVTGSGRNTLASNTIAVKDMGSVTNASQMFLDISSINKSVYIALSTWLNNGGSRDITVLKCWLE